jgi:hypothetical protein
VHTPRRWDWLHNCMVPAVLGTRHSLCDEIAKSFGSRQSERDIGR